VDLRIDSKVTLNNGVEMPRLGLGVFKAGSPRDTRSAIRWALDAGFRHIDTAPMYGNEKDVGAAVRESGLARDEIFVTTKVYEAAGYDATRKAFDASLKELDIDYVDLYLIHWPNVERVACWKAMEEYLAEGKCRAIGISNFTIRHVSAFLEAVDVVPAVNQVEFSPFLFQKELLEFCHARKIQLEAYSPLTRGRRLDDSRVVAVAKECGCTPGQVLIRWALQHGLVVIPKSSRKERIEENAGVFDFPIDSEQIAVLDSLNEDFRVCPNPEDLP